MTAYYLKDQNGYIKNSNYDCIVCSTRQEAKGLIVKYNLQNVEIEEVSY